MSYQINKFEVKYKGRDIPVAVHVVTDGDETNHIVSIDGHENFEIRPDHSQHWTAETGSGLSDELLQLIIEKHKSSNL